MAALAALMLAGCGGTATAPPVDPCDEVRSLDSALSMASARAYRDGDLDLSRTLDEAWRARRAAHRECFPTTPM